MVPCGPRALADGVPHQNEPPAPQAAGQALGGLQLAKAWGACKGCKRAPLTALAAADHAAADTALLPPCCVALIA